MGGGTTGSVPRRGTITGFSEQMRRETITTDGYLAEVILALSASTVANRHDAVEQRVGTRVDAQSIINFMIGGDILLPGLILPAIDCVTLPFDRIQGVAPP